MSPDRKKRWFDATSEYQRKAEEDMDRLYPEVMSDQGIERLVEGRLNGVRLDVVDSENLLADFMYQVLGRVKDPDDAMYCWHADEGHATFEEAVDMFRQALREGNVEKLIWQGFRGEKWFNRLRVEAVSGGREVKRPRAYWSAREISDRWRSVASQDKVRRKKLCRSLRKVMCEGDKGVVFALWTGIYLGVPVEKLLELYGDNNVKAETDMNGRWLTDVEQGDRRFLYELRDALMVEDTKGNLHIWWEHAAYRGALGVMLEHLGEYEWFKRQNETKGRFGMVEMEERTRAVVVFSGASEQVQRVMSEEFVNPARMDHVMDKYRNEITSKVITAYLESVDELVRW